MAPQVSAHNHRLRRRTGLVSAIAVSALVGGTIVTASATAFASPIGSIVAGSGAAQRIGTTPQAPQGAVRAGSPASDTVLHLGVSLQPRDPAELRALAQAVTTKGNSQYHRYLAKGQFGELYGATPQTVAAVDAELRAQGLNPGQVSSDDLSIPVTTTVSQASKAFATGFTTYRLPDGSTGYLNTAAPRFSGDVAADVVGVTGLDATFRPAAQHVVDPRLAGALKSPKAAAGTTAHKAPSISPADGTTSGPQLCAAGVSGTENTTATFGYNSSDGNGWYSAQNLATVYGMQHAANTAQGVTIGVLEWEQYSPSDLAAYQSCYGTHVPVSVVKVDGGSTVAPNPANNIGVESLLDLEDLTSLAPGASIINYQGPDLSLANGTPNSNFTDADWLDPMRRMVTDDNAQVVSISYGGCELDNDSTVTATENWTFIEAALQGQTVLNSSGDSGANSCLGDGTAHANSKVVSDPASQQFVTAVGGTSLHGDAGSVTRASWSTPASGSGSNAIPASGSGGGTSELTAMSSATNYQTGFTGPGFNAAACKPAAGYTCRQVPDVSALADPDTGYPVYVGGQWLPIGGTSGASPTWAALIAQTDANSTCAANGPAGFINPALYQAARTNYAGTFADVTQNGGNGPAMPTGVGYDLSTGLGEPNASAVTAALCASLPAPASGASTYHPVNPTRLLDTRSATTSAPQISATGMASVQVEGNTTAGIAIPASGVTAVVLNVTVTHTTGSGNLTAWGDGTTRPKTSNLNWTSGDTISNLVTVPLSGDGYVDFYATSATDVIADVQGYYTNDASGAEYVTHAPQRLLDTRSATGVSTTTPINYGVVNVPIRGVANIPQTATAVVLNITATGTTGAGFISAYPSGTTAPNVSNINWSKSGTTLPGLAIVPIGSNGAISLEVHGNSQVIADVFGYFDPTGALKYTKTGPQRLLDTRSTTGLVKAGQTVKLQVTGGSTGVPAGAQAVVLNVTVTGTTGSGNLSAYPDGSSQPTTSNLNWIAGWTVPNLVMVPVGADGMVDLHVTSNTQIIADVFGYFS